ncbi:MAG: hypothetical protein LBT19_01190 [Candidatus Nomurabacteria bacterium]|nr:hypothetical protein [Candidatus Nomurabacteria bacterium]
MDQQENTEFVNVGMDQPAGIEQREDVTIKVDGPRGGKGWMIVAICAAVVAIGLGVGLAFSYINAGDANKKVDEVQAKLDVRTEELNKFKEVTGAENADDVILGGGDVELGEIAKLLGDKLVSLDNAYVKGNGDYQIAAFNVVDGESGYIGYFYRALPDGKWKSSAFSGQAVPICKDVTDEDAAAFKDVLECAE